MDASISRYCLSLLLLTTIATSAGSNGTNQEDSRAPRVSGRIVKLYSGPKPEPHLCTDEGFQADLSNCAIFYRCVKERSGKFTVFRYQCAPGTVYDPDLETCNHPHSTSRAECGGKLKSTGEPYHTTNVNEINGAQFELPRPISTKPPVYTDHATIKNSSTLSSILPTKMIWETTIYNTPSTIAATQQRTTKYPEDQRIAPKQHQADTKLSNYKTMSSLPKTTQVSNLNNDDPCTVDGFMGDSENCRKFYRCVGNQRGGYIKYEFSCSESTVWDDEIQGCNHPWAVKRSKCGRSLSYDDKSTSQETRIDSTEKATTNQVTNNEGSGYKSNKTVQQQLQISYGSKVSQTQTQISNNLEVIQNQTQINHGNMKNNIKYLQSIQNQTQISHGSAVSQAQTQITHGNKEVSKSVQTQLQIDHSKDSSQSQVQIQESETSRPATASEQNHNTTKNKCSESGFMGDANDCKKFYRCVDNGRGSYTTFEYLCGDGTVWDPEIEACNHAWAVKQCGSKLSSVPVTEGHTTTTTKSTEYHTHSTKTSQSMYTTSHVPDIDDKNDVGYGHQNNQDITTSPTTTIETKTTVKPTNPTQVPLGSTDCTSSGFIGDANDCKIFYRCVDNGIGGFKKYEFKCGDGTLWDSNMEACNHAWAVKNCGIGSTPTNTDKQETTTVKEITLMPPDNTKTTVTLVQITTQTPTETDDSDVGYGSQNYKPSTTTIGTTKQPQGQENNKSNVCKTSGFMGDENDCKKFYRCVDNGNGGYIRYEFTCGEGTVWDPKIEACNHAWAVEKCGESNNLIENTESSSQSVLTTSSGDTSSTHTTQVSKETDTPVSASSTSTTSITTTIGTAERNKCTSSGFIGDGNNCKKFYRCVDNGDGTYTRYEFLCGEGTVWDSKIEACNHAWAVENCVESSSNITQETHQTTSVHPVIQDEEQDSGYATPIYEASETPHITSSTSQSTTSATSSETSQCYNSGFMGDRYDCKKFYRCVDNGKGGFDRYEFRCGEGTAWDGTIEACNHAWAIKGCVASVSSTTHFPNESTTQSISSSSASEDVQTSTVKTTTTTDESHYESELGSDKCLQDGFFGSKKDCKKFYRCVDNGKGAFIKYEFTCGDGTSWNQDIQSCDHVSSDRLCGSTSHITTTHAPIYLDDGMDTQSNSSTSTASTVETASESTQTTKTPQPSLDTCVSEGFYANLLDCKKFYRCVANGNGGYTKYDFNCGDGTIWNQEIQACDHESADKACIVTSTSQTNAIEFQSESTTVSYSTTKRQDVTNITESTEATENECISEGFFAHPNNCKKFIRCVNNGKGGYTRYEFSCGEGTVWVQEIQACDHDNDVTSCASQSWSTTESKPQDTDIHSSTSDSNTISSTEFVIPNREDDEYDTENSKEPLHDETDDCTSEGYFANKQDCRKFYRCVDNENGGFTKYDFMCGDGTAWDSNLQTCNYISEVPSCSGSTQPGSDNHQTTTNKNQGESGSSSTTIKTTTSSSESAGSSNSNKDDNCESEGYYGDKKDCKKFYRCVDNGNGGYTKYDFTCGDGTIWDQDITNCNHPRDVSNPSCDSNQGSTDSSSTTSSTTISSSQTTSSTTGSSSQSTSDCSQESSKKPTNNNVTCDKAGYYANPNDCKKFYRCVDWDGDGKRFSVFHFECGEGTIWDPALDTCNYEDSVYPQRDCSQTQSQGIGGETSTTEGTTSTTQESVTSEQTTTEQSTTSEQTTSQESTTSEQATPTNKPTTTQQTTTSEKTTTEEPTTSEQTMTSEKTTTQETVTSQQTTTQETTTSEKTTTQETVTSEKTTTQETTTSEKTTTQETETSAQTTSQNPTTITQESTTNEPTTTQQPTTSELTTTQQPATSEQTTTQQSTTSEQTTTQQSTPSEQTTTQQSTTSEQTTTQQSTTSEQTTTQQSTTSEQTTTQQSTTSEQTTTQQSTTSEQTTTQQSTTSEQTTTALPTSEQTTTQQSTTTDQTTTEESNTSQQTTTQQFTTSDQTTTQESNTNEPTTTQESSTGDQATTQQSTTSEQTTTEQPNQQTTEELSTTTDQTTEGTTPTEGTTDQTTTQLSSTESDSAEETSSEKECPETEDDQYLLVCPTSFKRHPKYCNMFYQCTEDDETYEANTAMFKCPNNTIYDENQTQCVSEDKADKKCDGEIANKRRFKRLGLTYKDPIVADKGKQSCSAAGYFSFEKHSECAKGFLKCERSKNGQLRGYVHQCPDGYIYWSISKRCERTESVRDCKRSSNDWNGRWNIPVERKNVATN